jgi:hypothetical protein
MGCAARAQQAPNPCDAATFNGKACQAAVKRQGYCGGGVWTPQQFQKYPYYYDLYQTYTSAGGLVTPAPVETCKRPAYFPFLHGGFGAIGASHSHAGG